MAVAELFLIGSHFLGVFGAQRERGKMVRFMTARVYMRDEKKTTGATTLWNQLHPFHDLVGFVPGAVVVEGLALVGLPAPPLLVGALDGLCHGLLAERRSAQIGEIIAKIKRQDLQGAIKAGLAPNVYDPPLLGAGGSIGLLGGNFCGGLGDRADPNIWRKKAGG
jgi:hypothetical protein